MNAVRCNLGFTLIELVTTLVILGILAAVAAPHFLNNQTLAERGYADELADSIRYAQRVAVASECDVRLIVSAANYSTVQRNACTTGSWNQPVLRIDGSPAAGTAPASIVADATATIQFDRNGSFVGAPAPVMTIGNFTISADPVSGLVMVQP